MDYFFEHHSATMVYFVHEGRGTLETTFGPIEYRKGDFLVVPKGLTHRFELGRAATITGLYESFAGDPEKAEVAEHGPLHHPQRERLSLSALARHGATERAASRSSPRSATFTRGACTRHILRRRRLAGRLPAVPFAVEDVRPLVADRSHVPPSGHTVFILPGFTSACSPCARWRRRYVAAVLPRNLDYLETVGYHSASSSAAAGWSAPAW